MKKTLILIVLILFISLSFLVNPTSIINKFSNGLITENLTFTGNQNVTKYINISRYANVTSAYLNLSGYEEYNSCYQESANTTNQTGIDGNCGLSYTGKYSCTTTSAPNDWICPVVYDGFWNAGTAPSAYSSSLIVNYSKPPNSTSAKWKYGFGYNENGVNFQYYNVTVPSSCFDMGQIQFNITSYINTWPFGVFSCFNSTNEIIIDTTASHYGYIYEEAILWGFYPNTPWIEIGTSDGIREWNYSSLFNITNNKTQDLSSSINSALNKGACDCTGCFLTANTCSIPILFSSSTIGILQYSAVNITYETFPFNSLVSPANASFSSVTKSLECNATNSEGALSNITLYVWRSNNSLYNDVATNYSNISGSSNSSKWNVTFDSTDTYHWSCISRTNISYYDWAETNNTLVVDISSPVTTMNYPANNSWKNTGSVDFNCTTDVTSPSGSFLYGDFNNSYSLNQTNGLVASGVQYGFSLTLLDGSYQWTCAANKSTDDTHIFSQYGNRTINVDTVLPSSAINSITTTAGSQTIQFNSTSSDANTLVCKYSIFNSAGSVDGLNNNVSYVCSSLTSATVTAYGTYNLTITVTDPASNANVSTLAFTTSALAPAAPPGGGGGGVAAVVNLSWSVLTDRGSTNYVIVMLPGSTESRDVVLTNKASQALNFVMSCRYVESKLNNQSMKAPDACEYVTISNRTVSLPAAKNAQRLDTFTVSVPDDYPIGDHTFNIVATDGNNKQNYVTVTIKVGELGVFGNLYYKLTSNKIVDLTGVIPGSKPVGIPYLVIFVIAFFASLVVLSLLGNFVIPSGPTKTAAVFLLSLVSSVIAVMAI